MAVPDRLKVGLVGAGSSAANIAETISTFPDLEFIGIANRTAENARKIAEKYSVPFVTSDYNELYDRHPDFVIISLPHALHYEPTVNALKRGIHVLVEKPIATRVDHAEEMIELARKNNLKLGVHFQCRFFGAVREAKKMIDEGVLGKILQANISVMWFRDTDYYKKSSWRGTWELEGGGSLINQAIHTVDEMIYLLGDVDTVFGFWDHKVHDIEVDDNTCAAFRLKSGVFGTMQTSTATKAAFPASLTIFGSEGAIRIEGNILTYYGPDGKKEVKDFTEGGQIGSAKDPRRFSLRAHSALLRDFVDAIKNDREPLINGEEGLKSLRFVRAVYESEGERIVKL